MKRRNTKNKKRILELFDNNHTITTKELLRLLPDMEVSTVYRNIERFVEDGLLREVHLDSNITTYERTGDVHDHFVCDDCHRVEKLKVHQRHIKSILPSGAIMNKSGIVVHGMCGECVKN